MSGQSPNNSTENQTAPQSDLEPVEPKTPTAHRQEVSGQPSSTENGILTNIIDSFRKDLLRTKILIFLVGILAVYAAIISSLQYFALSEISEEQEPSLVDIEGSQRHHELLDRLEIIEGEMAKIHSDQLSEKTWSIVADSVLDFSNQQGKNGWYYGFQENPESPISELSYKASTNQWSNGDRVEAGNWFGIWNTGGHPNGPHDSKNFSHLPPQPVVRRWVSTLDGDIKIEGEVSDENTNHFTDASGIICDILIDGNPVWRTTVKNREGDPKPYSVKVKVEVGSNIDFRIVPTKFVAGTSTQFTARIFSTK